MGVEHNLKIKPKFFTLDSNRTPVVLDGRHTAVVIVDADQVNECFERASEKIRLDDFDYVLVNATGGWFTYYKLAKLQNYQGQPIEIEVHRPAEGYGAIVKKGIPDFIKNNPDADILVIDDIEDTGGVLANIMECFTNAVELVAVRKRDVPNRIQANGQIESIIEIPNKYWAFGLGMNADTEGDGWQKNFGRDFPCLMVKL